MCNDKSWKSCSIVTIVFTSLLMLGMFIAVGVMNSMFGDNMQCYVDAAKGHENHDHSRRQMFEGMDKIAAQHPGIAKTLGSAVKQLPAFRSFAPEGRKLQSDDIPNDDSCFLKTTVIAMTKRTVLVSAAPTSRTAAGATLTPSARRITAA